MSIHPSDEIALPRLQEGRARADDRYVMNTDTKRLRVLVIDDEPDVLLLCRVNLSLAGMDVFEASDGESGIGIAVQESPDVVVLDVMMPRMDGFTVLKELKRRPATATIPASMLTG